MTRPDPVALNFAGRAVLVTGGTAGIGLATALRFGAAGARTVLTHRWGSADEDEVRRAFAEADAPPPTIVEADVSHADDTTALMSRIADEVAGIDVFVSNVAFAPRITGPGDYAHRDLVRSIDYTAWPMWAYTRALEERFGRYPRYVIGLSSDGPDGFFAYYDFVAMAKSVLETMCRYMNYRLAEHGVRVNVVRSRMVPTASFDQTFGASFHEFTERLGFADCYVSTEEVASVVFALATGLLDAVGGQVIMADRGFSFFDNLMGAYARSDLFGSQKEDE